jgi:dihydrofolate synthase / folylpolyglutamate synthase
LSELTYAGLVEQLFPRLTGGIRWGLERTVRMLAAAGNPERSYATIHVGGTNGKGSVASTMASILRAAGLRTGLYTSPHLCEFTERIQVDGVPIEREVLLDAARRLWPVVQREAPSFFEATTAIAFLTLAQVGVQVAVVEVGLGGRLDSTNVITPDVSVLTNVAMDHAQYLGDTLASIAREKAGIIKAAVPVVTSEPDPMLRDVFRSRAQELGAPFHVVDADAVTDISVDESGTRLIYTTDRFGELALHTPLIGAHQAMNTAVAVEALSLLPEARRPDVEAVQRGVRTVRWPGRVQIERRPDGVWLFDAAHNPAGIDSLVAVLGQLSLPEPLVLLIGVMGDKDWPQMLPALFHATDRAVLTTPYSAPEGRRWDPVAVLREVPSAGAEVVADFAQALARARALAGSGAVIVTGSFHTVGDALLELGVEPFPPDPGLPPAAAAV